MMSDESITCKSEVSDDRPLAVLAAMKRSEDHDFVLDPPREKIFRTLADLLVQLSSGKLQKINRFNRLILGRKAVGKSALLDAVEAGCACAQIDCELLVVRIRCNASQEGSEQRLPPHEQAYQILKTRLQKALPKIETTLGSPSPSKQLATIGEQEGYRFVFLIDEFQSVYSTWTKSEADLFISSLIGLTESNSGRFLTLVTGSGSELRRLAFAKIQKTEEVTARWPNYNMQDLNHTKLQPMFLMPFQDFKSFCELCKKREVNDPYKAYLGSGGYPGLVTNEEPEDLYSISTRSLSPTQSNILQAMIRCHTQCSSGSPPDDNLDKLERLMRLPTPVRWRDVSECVGENLDVSLCYELMDDGFILYTTKVESEPTVQFSTAIIYLHSFALYTSSSKDVELRFQEIADMAACNERAKEPVLRTLLTRSEKWLNFKMQTYQVSNFPTDFELIKHAHTMFKWTGKNGLIYISFQVNQNSSKTVVHCVWLVLGNQPLKSGKLDKELNLFREQVDQIQNDRLSKLGIAEENLSVKMHFITTRYIEEQLRQKRSDFTFWDKKCIAEHGLWPDYFKQIHPMFK